MRLEMNEKISIWAGGCFIIAFITSIYPRLCIDRYKKMISKRGGDPNQRVTFKMMASLDANLYKRHLIWLFISMLFLLGFTVLIFLDLFKQ